MTSKISNEESNALEGKITSAEVLNFLYKKLKMTRVQGPIVLVVNFESCFFLKDIGTFDKRAINESYRQLKFSSPNKLRIFFFSLL